MAEIVGAFGVPHIPPAPMFAEQDPHHPLAKLYDAVYQHVKAVDPDVLVVFDSDHFSSFFLNNLPAFAVGVAQQTHGPGNDDDWPGLPVYEGIPVHESLANQVYVEGLRNSFDLSLTQEFALDHSIVVPLHFLNPGMAKPFVPVWVNGLAHPIPLARRCHALGQMVRQAVESFPSQARVAIVASGTISGDIGTASAFPGGDFGPSDMVWVEEAVGYLRRGETEDLLNAATAERLRAAGNATGEMLNWIALLGAVGNLKPRFLETDSGNAWAAWRWD